MDLKQEIEKIKERNKRVELDKKWKTSLTRRILIVILTYIVVVIYSFSIDKINNIFLSSLVPVFGFVLSTMSLMVLEKFGKKELSS